MSTLAVLICLAAQPTNCRQLDLHVYSCTAYGQAAIAQVIPDGWRVRKILRCGRGMTA